MTGADMTDDEITSIFNATRPFTYKAFARALLARQPAAIDKEAACRVCNGHGYRTAMSATGEGAFNETCVYCKGTGKAAPLANEASKPAVRNCQTGWADFCLMAKHDGVTCPSESCDIDDGIRASPSVEQDERGAFAEWLKQYFKSARPSNTVVGWMFDAFKDGKARAASTSANVAQEYWTKEQVSAVREDAKRLHEKLKPGVLLDDNANVAQGAEAFPYQKTLDSIAAATSVSGGHVAISVAKFVEAFGAANVTVLEQSEEPVRKTYAAIMAEELGYSPSVAPPAQTALTDDARDAIRECIEYLTPAAKQFSDLGMPGMGDSKHARCIRTLRALLTAAQPASGGPHE